MSFKQNILYTFTLSLKSHAVFSLQASTHHVPMQTAIKFRKNLLNDISMGKSKDKSGKKRLNHGFYTHTNIPFF